MSPPPNPIHFARSHRIPHHGRPRATGWIFLLLAVALAGCVPMKKIHAPMTHIEGRRPLERDFRTHVPVAPNADGDFLTYHELVNLAHRPHPRPDGPLNEKLERFWNTPIVSNHAWQAGRHPQRAYNRYLGGFLRVGTWNLEKSLHLRAAADALTSEQAYRAMMKPQGIPESRRREMLRQRKRFANSDILIFQEMDIGVDRSDYVHSARLLGDKLGMNYAYAPKQLELTPILRSMDTDTPEGAVDPNQYRGVFGLVVMSKYPIKSAVCFQLDHQPYDWYQGELEKYDAVEQIRRIGSEEIFETPVDREVKIGGRVYFRVDLEVPGLPDDTLTIIPVHLEIRARPEDRRRQLEEILSHIKDIPHPVILAGDFNSSQYDLSPTSLQRVIARGSQNPGFWLFTLSNVLVPAQSIYNTLRATLNEVKNLYNPLAFHSPVFFPNETAVMFDDLRNYRFDDGTKFDFRGHGPRSINGSRALLANSNEKMFKGYRTTYQVERPIGPYGRHRLDWIFVKSSFHHDTSDSHRLAPHFGETILAFDRVLTTPLSDHRPCVVDLPLRDIAADWAK